MLLCTFTFISTYSDSEAHDAHDAHDAHETRLEVPGRTTRCNATPVQTRAPADSARFDRPVLCVIGPPRVAHSYAVVAASAHGGALGFSSFFLVASVGAYTWLAWLLVFGSSCVAALTARDLEFPDPRAPPRRAA